MKYCQSIYVGRVLQALCFNRDFPDGPYLAVGDLARVSRTRIGRGPNAPVQWVRGETGASGWPSGRSTASVDRRRPDPRQAPSTGISQMSVDLVVRDLVRLS